MKSLIEQYTVMRKIAFETLAKSILLKINE